MTLTLTEELEAYRRAVRAQAESTIGPFVKALDREQRFSREAWDALRATNIFALPFPETAGGHGGSFLAFVVATEEIAAVGATPALYPGTTVQVASTLLHYGTSSQIECWVPMLLRGDAPAAWAFTEPQTGSDPKQLLTTAVRDGDGWVLTGQKLFISLARQAAIALVFARTSDDRVGAFLVDPSSPGWSTGQPFELMAFGGVEAAPVYLDDVRSRVMPSSATRPTASKCFSRARGKARSGSPPSV
jgi:alkylation response protein AidB-like acyl-CoA dehydrogenase